MEDTLINIANVISDAVGAITGELLCFFFALFCVDFFLLFKFIIFWLLIRFCMIIVL